LPAVLKLPIMNAHDIAFRHLTIADGLSQSIVNRIVQDDQGFMWFGAQGGLNRYDGYRFKVYKHDPAKQNSLSGIYVRALFKDRSGELWIGVDEFLDKFNPVTETFTHYRIGSTVVNLSQDRAGILWLSTSNGLERFDPVTGRRTAYRHDKDDAGSLSSSDVLSSGSIHLTQHTRLVRQEDVNDSRLASGRRARLACHFQKPSISSPYPSAMPRLSPAQHYLRCY
jgi:ligand-binding sensor domain-containing protein